MSPLDLDELNRLDAEQLAALLSPGSPDRVATIRAAAEGGVAEAQLAWGQMLLDGDGAEKDEQAAIAWFHKAAQQGNALAINMIGRCFDLGWGVQVDKTRAAEWFALAAKQGLDWGMYNYATLLALGDGVAEDRPAALDLLREAAAMGNAKAENFIGSFYEDGWVVERDLVAAAGHYRIAAEGGDFRGCFNHARMLAESGDRDGALYWLGRIRETATDAFMTKAEAWLLGSPIEYLRDHGLAALRGL